MPFTLTWTGPTGSDKITVPDAKRALEEYLAREDKVVRLIITDDHKRKLTPDDLYELIAIADEASA